MAQILIGLSSTQTEGDALTDLSGYYMAVVSDLGSDAVKLQIESNGTWRDTELSFSSGAAGEQVFAGCPAFRYRFVVDSAGPTIEVGLIDRASFGAHVS